MIEIRIPIKNAKKPRADSKPKISTSSDPTYCFIVSANKYEQIIPVEVPATQIMIPMITILLRIYLPFRSVFSN